MTVSQTVKKGKSRTYDELLVNLFQAFQFAGDVGGMLGLWIGFSAMGLVQLIEFILLIVWTQIKAVCFCKYRVGANG
jgi:hypothetical protein